MYSPWYNQPSRPGYMLASPMATAAVPTPPPPLAASAPQALHPYPMHVALAQQQPPAARRTSGYLAQPARQTGWLFEQPLGTTPGSYGTGGGGGGGGIVQGQNTMLVYQQQQNQQQYQQPLLTLQSPPAAVYISAPAATLPVPPPSFLVPPPTVVAAAPPPPAVVYVVCPPTAVQNQQQMPPTMQAVPSVAPAVAGAQEGQSATMTASTTATTPTTAASPATAPPPPLHSTATAPHERPPPPAPPPLPSPSSPLIIIRVVFFGQGGGAATQSPRLWVRVADAAYASVPTGAQLRAEAVRLAVWASLPDRCAETENKNVDTKRATLYVMREGPECALRIVADGGVVVPAAGVEAVVPLKVSDDESPPVEEASLQEALGSVLLQKQHQQQHQQQNECEEGPRRHVFLAVDVDDMWMGPAGGEALIPPAGGSASEPSAKLDVLPPTASLPPSPLPALTTTVTEGGDNTETEPEETAPATAATSAGVVVVTTEGQRAPTSSQPLSPIQEEEAHQALDETELGPETDENVLLEPAGEVEAREEAPTAAAAAQDGNGGGE
ncbi:hypothetical protein JDV02_002636 [Purpureocillium takamizusanense]|uniref:Uncharacterized protein n=1 Tax=Purpureocillium takamizusanense TaxID=2060973 RepID=A0A9Q8V8V5_9HYPO|nr:uncharacterized protein JDV02_002636 [Purpureocillium takamizusanense]UNI16172.1 hypothetical protein JDV02_002636 [Purpureocillium takamizusanense]